MDEEGLWRLFFETGLPQVYLAIAGERAARAAPPLWAADRTAFRPGGGEPTLI